MSMHPITQLLGAETRDEQVAAMQEAINNGSVWLMEGSMGRAAMDMLRAGCCMLGEESHRDYWGNRVPSRTEVKPGTVGSREYCEARDWGEE